MLQVHASSCLASATLFRMRRVSVYFVYFLMGVGVGPVFVHGFDHPLVFYGGNSLDMTIMGFLGDRCSSSYASMFLDVSVAMNL